MTEERRPPIFQKLQVRFAKLPRLRFLSHHDLMRAFHRALRRAGLPVRMTEGFNPRPRVVLPHALEVGVSSADEFAEIELSEWIPPPEFERRLSGALGELADGEGLETLGVRLMPPRRRGSSAVEAHYEAELVPEDARAARVGAERFMESDSWPIARAASGSFSKSCPPTSRATRRDRLSAAAHSGAGAQPRTGAAAGDGSPALRSAGDADGRSGERFRKGAAREIDIRPHVIDVSLEGRTLSIHLRLGRPGAARPREVLGAVLGREASEVLDVPLRKTKTVLAGPA